MNMATALYIVLQSRGKWWVDFEGHSKGPFETRELAALDARSQAQFASHVERASEVLVPDGEGKYWIVWSSRENAGVPRRINPASDRPAAEPDATEQSAAA